jgi:ribonuclease Z
MPNRARVSTLLLVLLCATAGCDAITGRLIDQGVKLALKGTRNDLMDDGKLNVVMCGTGSPLAAEGRAAACTAVLAGGHFFLVDVGPAAVHNLALWRMPLDRLDGVLLTHFHSDHMGDLGEAVTQSWIAGRTTPLPVYGPTGVDRVVAGFKEAYALDRGYRTTHHDAANMPPEGGMLAARTAALPSPDEAAVVFEGDGFRVTAFRVDHTPVSPAYGYRFDFGGRSVVVSGDTKPTDNLVRHSKGASILVAEALAARIIERVSRGIREGGNARLGKMSSDILDYHTSPAQAIEMARDAGVEALVLTHLVPAPQNRVLEWLFLRGTEGLWSGEVILARDGMLLSLPPNSSEFTLGEVS